MSGKILKGIAGFYYVQNPDGDIYECRAKGIFRKEKQKPLVGDDVEIEVLDEKNRKGNLVRILRRKNVLFRPEVANVDQVFLIFAITDPKPNLNLLDRFLAVMQQQGIDVILGFNKCDLDSTEEEEKLRKIYEKAGCRLLFFSIREKIGIDRIREALNGKITAVAGPSGVGKSSLTNCMSDGEIMEVGEISKKIARGKNTTRHSELVCIWENTFLVDTPGFTSLYLLKMEAQDLKNYYPEFTGLEDQCRFQGCVHVNEPDCAVKQALANGEIHPVRYENYRLLYQELKEKRSVYHEK